MHEVVLTLALFLAEGPKEKVVGTSPVKSARADGLGYCSDYCTCGCNSGRKCGCGGNNLHTSTIKIQPQQIENARQILYQKRTCYT